MSGKTRDDLWLTTTYMSTSSHHLSFPFFITLPGQTNIFVHIEGNYVLEAKFTSLVELNQLLVSTDGRGTGRETQNERTLSRGLELVDTLLDIVGYHAKVKYGETSKLSKSEQYTVNTYRHRWKPRHSPHE